jgi:hypothetical protein
MKKFLRQIALGSIGVFLVGATLQAQVLDPNFGADTGLQEDDDLIEMTLGFMFPFDGTNYDTVAINTNGGVTLGIGGVFAGDSYVDYDLWNDSYFESDFTDVGNPIILPFETDLDNGNGVGDIYFKTDASSAVITWDGMATNQDEMTALITFQLTLNVDGSIMFGYGPITGTGDLVADLDQGIVVGISNGAGDPPPASSDISAAVNMDGTTSTVYEIWCYDEVALGGDCFDQTGRPDNNGFDMANETGVVFTPNAMGGFDLSDPAGPPPPPPPVNLPASGGQSSWGCTVGPSDGRIDPTLPLLMLISLVYIFRRRLIKA